MKKSDFFYELPERLIAQRPIEPRDHSRLLVLHRDSGEIEHRHFYDIGDYLQPGDCLILNDTKVLPARIYGQRVPDGAVVEFLLLNSLEKDLWEALAGPGKKARAGTEFTFGSELRGRVEQVLDNGNRVVRFSFEGSFYEILDRIGQMPLPHYIHQTLQDRDRYQTVYARERGSAAAPTAGLHFTKERLDALKQQGVQIGTVTLHVGIGTFRPVKEENIEDHKMHSEHYTLPAATAELIHRTKEAGHRVVCVGTTSCRTLESAARTGIHEQEGWTDIFIYPPYQFRCMDALITNFHLPESTLIMLVSAFAGRENVLRAYREAVEKNYRFFSFGDAMLVI